MDFFTIVILILPEVFSWQDVKFMFLKCRGLRSRIATSLQRITVIPVLPGRDLLEAGLLIPEFRFGF
jgi:hypothetical protein